LPVPIEEIVESTWMPSCSSTGAVGTASAWRTSWPTTSCIAPLANSFAGLVLVPAAELRREFAAAVKTARRAGLRDATLWSEAGKEHVARWLAAKFEVSEQVIERRLEKDGLWPGPPAPVP